MKKLVLILLLTVSTVLSIASPTAAAGVPKYWTAVCGHNYVPVNVTGTDGKTHGNYFNVYNAPSGGSCVRVQKGKLDFYYTQMTNTIRWDYPNVSSGVEWGRYTCYDGKSGLKSSPGSQCMRYPVREKYDGNPVTSVGHVWSHMLSGNVSYDIWFNKWNVKDLSKLKRNDGAEVMIWLSHPGVPMSNYFNRGAVARIATISGNKYYVLQWISSPYKPYSHTYTAYISEKPLSYFPATHLNLFFKDAIKFHRLSPMWWLTAIDFGAEINQGGTGFAVRNYQLYGVA
jgi:hypothetical protein